MCRGPGPDGRRRDELAAACCVGCPVPVAVCVCRGPGPDGRRRGEQAAVDARGELPDGERHRAQLGGHDAPVRLHVRAAEAQPEHARVQADADGGADEPGEESREARRGELAAALLRVADGLIFSI